MANFTLSTQRLPSGGSSGGLRSDMIQANGGAGSLRAAQISPNAGQARYTATNLPQPVENMVSKGTQHFLGAVSEAAFKYQEREAAYLANEAALQYQIKAREAYSGYEDENGKFVPGLSNAKGVTAGPAYNVYTAALDERMNDMLGSMEPRVKQKALIQIQTAKNQALAKGATHRAQQMQVAEQDQRFRIVAEQSAQGAADPSLFLRDKDGQLPRDAEGKSIQDRVVSQYDSLEEGMTAYWDMIVETGENIYLKPKSQGGGAEAALQFAATIGDVELTGSTGHKNTLDSRVQSWMKRDVQNEISAANRRDAVAERARKAWQESNHADLVARQDTPYAADVAEVNRLIRNGGLTPSVGAGQKAIALGGAAGQGDAEAYMFEKQRIRNAEIVDGVLMTRDKTGTLVPLGRAWAANSLINTDKAMMSDLESFAKKQGTVEQSRVNGISARVQATLEASNPIYAFGADMGELKTVMGNIEQRIESLAEVGSASDDDIYKQIIDENIVNKPYLAADVINGWVGPMQGMETPSSLGQVAGIRAYIRKQKQLYVTSKGAEGMSPRDVRENSERVLRHINRLKGESRDRRNERN